MMSPETPPDESAERQDNSLRLWRPRSPRARLWMGVFASQLYGFLQIGLLVLITTRFDWRALGDFGEYSRFILGASGILIVPFSMGFVAAYFWNNPSKGCLSFWGYIFLNFVLTCLSATLFLREGTICLVMAAPILMLLMAAGSTTGVEFWKKDPPFLRASVLPLLTLLLLADASRPHAYYNRVETIFHSPASPQQLWRYTASYPENRHAADWWLWKIGLPMPMRSVGEARVGGRRDCRFSGGVSIGERVVKAQSPRQLEFIIDQQPRHPEVLGHFELQRGRIELIPDGRGGTILRGTSWYQLKVFPAAYFDLWTVAIVHQVHRRVFQQMSELAQRDAHQHAVQGG